MTDLILPRRQFLKTLSGIIAAPAIVRADSLMKVVAPKRQMLYPLWGPPLNLGDLIDIELFPPPETRSVWLISWGEEEARDFYPSQPSGAGKSII
jgi:hypothetical protein